MGEILANHISNRGSNTHEELLQLNSKKLINQLNGLKTCTDTFSKKTYKLPTGKERVFKVK